ncbi:hypothetical protein D3Z62_18975 [Lachnospiraceae bacterium]|nr:hypothetical protein [Lachnospiraceae bacterium]
MNKIPPIILYYFSKMNPVKRFGQCCEAADIYAEMKTAGSEMGNWFGTGIENENESDQRSSEHQL